MILSKEINSILVNHDKKIIIDWSAKSNCTNIAIMFFKYINLYEKMIINNPIEIHNYREKYTKNNYIVKELLLDASYLKIKFVRNPYSRAISSYLHLSVPNLSFYEFLLNLYNKNYPYNIHYYSQHHSLELQNKIYNEIIKVENINSEVERINQKYNINFIYESHSIHQVNKNLNDNNFVGYKKFKDIKNIPPYKYFYDDDKIKNLAIYVYGTDMILYNYTFQEFLNTNS